MQMNKTSRGRQPFFLFPLLGLALLIALGFWSRTTRPTLAASGYTVVGGTIRSPQGDPVQLRGVNWFGFEVNDHVVHGLWARNWQEMILQMKQLGFNAVRLPVCPPTLQGSSVSSIDYSRNPDLAGKNSLQILDMIMAKFDAEGMYILLDHHRPDCNAISELWYTGSYSEQQWINDLTFMAQRYSHLSHFFAIDLKNEPHGSATWGANNPGTDWNKAAERAGSAILAANPNLLIFVEGIQESSVCSGNVNHWWGGNLEPQACTPINLPADKLVLSPHVYGPDVYNQPYFNVGNFPANMPAIWDAHFGQFAGTYAVVLGEFGGRYGHGGDPKDKTWQDALVDYLIAKNMRGGFYWSWNPNSGDTGGILQDDWNNVWTDKMALLQRLWGSGNPGPTNTPSNTPTATVPGAPTATPTVTASPTTAPTATNTFTPGPAGSCRVTYISNDWGNGFTADILLENLSGTAWNGWVVSWSFSGNQQITNAWNGVASQNGQQVQISNANWNAQVPAVGNTRIGFQATYSGVNSVPTTFQINGMACNGSNPGPTATNSPVPPATATPSPVPTNTNTPLPTATNTNTPLTTATATNTATHTPLPPATSTALPTAIPTHTATATPVVGGGNCQVTYTVTNDWGNGFTADVAVKNLSGAAWSNWNVGWNFSGNQQITNLWNGTLAQSGQQVQVTNAGWNGTVAAGGTVSFGFQASYSGANAKPATFSVNGVACGGTSPAPTPVPAPVVSCQASYVINNAWNNGFNATVTLTNRGNTTWNGWTNTWSFASNQQIANLWNGVLNQSGQQVQVTNAGWNGPVAPNASVNFGFQASYSGNNPTPAALAVNGVVCDAVTAASASANTTLFLPAVMR